MSRIKIAEFMKINGSFDGGRTEGRWFSIPRTVSSAKARRPASHLVPSFMAASKPAAAARARGVAGMLLF